jgi:hypothetical protein
MNVSFRLYRTVCHTRVTVRSNIPFAHTYWPESSADKRQACVYNFYFLASSFLTTGSPPSCCNPFFFLHLLSFSSYQFVTPPSANPSIHQLAYASIRFFVCLCVRHVPFYTPIYSPIHCYTFIWVSVSVKNSEVRRHVLSNPWPQYNTVLRPEALRYIWTLLLNIWSTVLTVCAALGPRGVFMCLTWLSQCKLTACVIDTNRSVFMMRRWMLTLRKKLIFERALWLESWFKKLKDINTVSYELKYPWF